jgi:hypothetical protein
VNGDRAVPLPLPAGPAWAELRLTAAAALPTEPEQAVIALAVAQLLGTGDSAASTRTAADWRFAGRWWLEPGPEEDRTED